MKRLFITKPYFSFFIIGHVIFYLAILFLSDILNFALIFSGVWRVKYLWAIRRFSFNPIDDFAAQRISYAEPNMYWIHFAREIGKNYIRFVFFSLFHLILAVLAILIYRDSLSSPLIAFAVLIATAVLPITYLFILRRLYSLWSDNEVRSVKTDVV